MFDGFKLTINNGEKYLQLPTLFLRRLLRKYCRHPMPGCKMLWEQ